MNRKNQSQYIKGVDDLVIRTPLEQVLNHYGLPLPQAGAREHRMNCVFNEECGESKYGNLSVELDSFKRLYCHSCHVRGNLLVLLHGLEKGCAPAGGRLRGQEFKDAVEKLKEISNASADSK